MGKKAPQITTFYLGRVDGRRKFGTGITKTHKERPLRGGFISGAIGYGLKVYSTTRPKITGRGKIPAVKPGTRGWCGKMAKAKPKAKPKATKKTDVVPNLLPLVKAAEEAELVVIKDADGFLSLG